MAEGTIRVLLAEDIAILRKGLMVLLGGADDVVVAGEAADGLEAVSQADALVPDVVLMDLSMPRLDGAEAVAEIKRRHPGMRVLVLTAHLDADLVRKTRAAGADGYLLKNVGREELLLAVRRAAVGVSSHSPEVLDLLQAAGKKAAE